LTDRTNKPKEIVMNPIRHIRRIAAVLAGLVAALVAFATPAFAMVEPVPGGGGPAVAPPQQLTPVRTLVAGGMPGWQITLIAAGAALLAATVAVLLDRARAARRNPVLAAA
jgi:hypothetical protein